MKPSSGHTLVKARLEKLECMRKHGINPYPYRYGSRIHTATLKIQYEAGTLTQIQHRIAGRLESYRDHGKSAFGEIHDESGGVQIYFDKGALSDRARTLLDLLDLGDFLGVEGAMFTTRRGEATLRVQDYQVLAKAIRPLPDKWHGLQDPELKYRRRSEYLVTNPDEREHFRKRSKAITAMREFLDAQGFLEVETPLIQPIYGGASARPFTTQVNALGEEYYLSISPEIYLKRLIAGGFERVYTICKNFRNEGIDRTHNPEFTMMECYQSYADYTDMMELTENLYAHIFTKVRGTTKITYQDPESQAGMVEINLTPPWRRITMLDAVNEYAGIDACMLSEKELRDRISRIEDKEFFNKTVPRDHLERWSWGELVQALFGYYVEHKLIQPTFVIDHPRESTPLCKIHRTDERLIERFEPFIYGWEIGNAYSELNDPVRQRTLLEKQRAQSTNDEIPDVLDEEFLRAIEIGIPPTGGLGLGIDRLAMILTNAYAIKDVIFFPLMRCSQDGHDDD